MSNRKPTSVSRLQKDYLRLKKDPVPYITAEPLPQNILEWHFVVKGPEGSPYQGGYYHGTLHFPIDFPFKPPSIYMITPNGRFKTNTRLCLSISDFHPDTWNPAWSVATILTGLLSFMLETTPTLGSTECSAHERERLARKSLRFNIKNDTFKELFPDIVREMNQKLMAQNSGRVPTPNDQLCADGITLSAGQHQLNGGLVNGLQNGMAINQYRSSTTDTAATTWQTLCSNLLVLVSFAIFAFVVNHVIKSLNTE